LDERRKNMNISKRKQGILAIICTIAMIVTSITVYNPREVKADTDYSTLTFTKVTESMDSTYAYCITDNTLIDFGKLNFYGVNYMQVIGSGNSKMDEATVTIDGVVQTNNDIAFDRAPAITGFIVSKLSDNAYHELKIEGKGGNITIVLKKGNVGGEIETTTGSSTKPLDPSTIKDSEWTLAKDSKTVSYYIADGKAGRVNVKPQLEGDSYYMAFLLAGPFKSVTFDGVSKDVKDTSYRAKVSDLTSGYHTLVVTDYYGNESVTIYFKVAGEEGTTKYTVSIDGTEKQYEKGTTITVPADGQGYYDVTKKLAYAPGTELTVNENMTLKSIKLNVTMTSGASIRLAAPTGLRFQTTVKSENGIAADEILNSKTVTTGTLITTLASYEHNGNTLTRDSKYTFLDIANDGWFNDGTKTETGKFCGSIIKIKKENYGRKFIAVGYATINYSNGGSKTVYANVTANNAKSIAYVAEQVKKSEAYNKYKDIIDKYINGEEISK
jgi:hypothetical protein